jgi:hypothetical protein
MQNERNQPDQVKSISIRRAHDGDASALEWIAQRDTRRVPPAPLLVAVADGRIRAARSLATGATVADPFRPTAHLTAMLEVQAAQLMPEPAPRARLAWWRRRQYAHA